MRVLHVIPYASALYGGPVAVVAQMTEILSVHGIDVDVVTTTANGKDELDIPAGQPIAKGGARYFYFPRQGPKFWMFSWPMRQWLYRHLREYDLVHVHALFAYTTLPACGAARHFNKPYVITPHGVLDPWCLTHKWWKKLPYYYLLERHNLAHARFIHATSSFEADGLARLGFASNTRVIPLNVEIPAEPDRNYAGKHSLKLLFLSRLDPIKGLPILLKALAVSQKHACENVGLIIAGQGADEYVAELRLLAKELGISGSVRFAGFLHGEDKARVLKEADIFVLPSYHENFSLAAAEAMAAGLPVIVSDQVGIAREISEAGAGIVVPADSPAALAEAICKFADPHARQIAGENGRNLAKRKFSREQFGESLLALYVNAAGHSRY